jgi:hypothetical protein
MKYANARIYFRNHLLQVYGADTVLDIVNQPYSWLR